MLLQYAAVFIAVLPYFIFFALTLWPFGSGSQIPLKKTSLKLPEAAEPFHTIRISLGEAFKNPVLETSSAYRLTDARGNVLSRGRTLAKTTLVSAVPGIGFGKESFEDAVLFFETEGEGMKVDGRAYRSTLIIRRNSRGTLSLVNELPIEDYLKGVLPWEVNPKWTLEVLKAQAVASRTYALFKVIENQNLPYDLTRDVLSQVYGGKTSEHPVTDRAVEETRGELLLYRSEIFPAYFHSTCGGGTTPAHTLWDVEPHPVLQGVACPFCRGSKHYRWRAEFTRQEIEEKLRKQKFPAQKVEGIRASDEDDFGRARTFVIESTQGRHKIRANDFRLWMDPGRLKSTLIHYLEKSGEVFHFRGRGWGHGAGMCQYGAKELSDLGYTYRQILDYYYPGSQVTKYWD